MIYFDSNTKNESFRKFHYDIEHGGYFFIEHSGSLSGDTMGFKDIMYLIYRKE